MKRIVVLLGLVVVACSAPAASSPAPLATAALVNATPTTAVATSVATLFATPTPAHSTTPAATPQFVSLSGNITTTAGQPLRAAINIYPVTDFCRLWSQIGPDPNAGPKSQVTGANTFTGPYAIGGLTRGSYFIVASVRTAPGGNWFWPVTLECPRAQVVELTKDTVLDFKIPQ